MSILVKESDEPVTDRRQLVDYFAQAEKPKSEWLIGCEHEKFPFRLSTLKPVSYDEPQGLRDLLNGMKEFGWKPTMEGDNIIGLSRERAAISFEPGGQVELAGSPLHNLHEVAAETRQHLVEVNQIGERLGIGFLAVGFHPTAKREDIPWVPKQRYKIMRDYMPKKGKLGLDMMVRTCTVQVNLDFSDETDMVKKMRVALALQPVVTALFASSPFVEGKPNGYLSNRMRCWQDTDPDRSGAFPLAFANGFGYEQYTDYALGVPMYFVYRNGHYIDCTGQNFHNFMAGKLPALPGELPTLTDWANHLTTLFPDVRLKKVLEMRGADVGSAKMLHALSAFWVGLLYDAEALNAAGDMVKDWTAEDRAKLHDDVPKLGLATTIDKCTLREAASVAVILAQQGLRRRAIKLHGGVDETGYLDPLFSITENGQSRADQLLIEARRLNDFKIENLFITERLQASASQ